MARPTTQLPPLAKFALKGSHVGRLVLTVVLEALLLLAFRELALAAVVWHPDWLGRYSLGEYRGPSCVWGPFRSMLSRAKLCAGLGAGSSYTLISLMMRLPAAHRGLRMAFGAGCAVEPRLQRHSLDLLEAGCSQPSISSVRLIDHMRYCWWGRYCPGTCSNRRSDRSTNTWRCRFVPPCRRVHKSVVKHHRSPHG